MLTKIPFKIIAIDGKGFHLIIKLRINGKQARVIIDTGASRTLFDKARIIEYMDKDAKFKIRHSAVTGIGTSSMENNTTSIKKIIIGDLEITNYKTLLFDLSNINQSYHSIGLKQIDGILGSDILLKYKGVINYPKKMLILEFDNDVKLNVMAKDSQ